MFYIINIILSNYLIFKMNFIQFAITHLIGFLTPGPGFILVVENSLLYNKKVGMLTSVCLNLAYLIHLSLIVFTTKMNIESDTIPLFIQNIFNIFSAIFLLFLAYKTFKKKSIEDLSISDERKIADYNVFLGAFFVGLFNSKGFILFNILLDTFSNKDNIQYYAMWIPFSLTIYHYIMVRTFSNKTIRAIFIKKIKNINKVFAFLLFGMAILNLLRIKF